MAAKTLSLELTGPDAEDAGGVPNVGMPRAERLARAILLLQRVDDRIKAEDARAADAKTGRDFMPLLAVSRPGKGLDDAIETGEGA